MWQREWKFSKKFILWKSDYDTFQLEIGQCEYVLSEDFLKMSVCEICVKLGRVLIKDLVHIYTKPDQILELPAIVLHTGPHRT